MQKEASEEFILLNSPLFKVVFMLIWVGLVFFGSRELQGVVLTIMAGLAVVAVVITLIMSISGIVVNFLMKKYQVDIMLRNPHSG